MKKKYFQAKKQTNPFGKKHPNAAKNRLIVILMMVGIAAIGVSSGVTYLSGLSSADKDEPEAVEKVAQKKEPPKKKTVVPIADDDFKGAKEYNFYTQLEERSLVTGAEDNFGGMALNNISQQTSQISLESLSLSSVSNSTVDVLVKQDASVPVVMAPLVLESASTSNNENVNPKPVAITKPIVQQPTKPVVAATVAIEAKNINLQVGSFTARKEAEIHKAKLAKHGFSSRIVQGKNQTKQDVYRVQIGPFGQKEVTLVKDRLNNLKVGFFVVK